MGLIGLKLLGYLVTGRDVDLRSHLIKLQNNAVCSPTYRELAYMGNHQYESPKSDITT